MQNLGSLVGNFNKDPMFVPNCLINHYGQFFHTENKEVSEQRFISLMGLKKVVGSSLTTMKMKTDAVHDKLHETRRKIKE